MNQPRPESRISNLEKEFVELGSRIEEASSDTAESLNALQIDLTENVTVLRSDLDQGFNQAHAFVQERFGEINTRLDRIETTMATKDDISRLESDISSIKSTQEQILKLLQQKGE